MPSGKRVSELQREHPGEVFCAVARALIGQWWLPVTWGGDIWADESEREHPGSPEHSGHREAGSPRFLEVLVPGHRVDTSPELAI